MDVVTDSRDPAAPEHSSGFSREEVESWRQARLARDHERIAPRAEEFVTLSGRPIKDVYTSADLADFDERRDLGLPGEYPFTRGVHASMHRGRPWTIRQVAGFGQAEDTNNRYKYLLAHGEDGLSTDFDLPTLLGFDSDHPVFGREVGKIGVAIDTVVDMHALFDGIPLEDVSVSLTINAPATVLIAMFRVVGEERGISGDLLTGTAQNDILKEYTAQNEFIYPPGPSVDLVVDTMDYCAQVMPSFNPVSMSGYHPRDAGCTAPQEIGFTLAGALCYLERAMERGIAPDALAPRVSFFWNVQNDFFEEVAKLRAARRLWARLTKERLKCTNPRSWLMRSHAQNSGASLTAQQPLNNIARTAVQALAAVVGGTQSLHTNSFDEAFAIPSEEAIKVAVRTQQILLHESGVADVVDPLAGSYYVETLTTQLEEEALELITRIDEMGGMVEAIKSGYVHQLIADSAWEQQKKIESNDRTIVGVNEFVDDDQSLGGIEIFRPDPGVHARQVRRLAEVKRSRDEGAVTTALKALQTAAADPMTNRMPFVEDAIRARATVGEISDVFRDVYGEYAPSTVF